MGKSQKNLVVLSLVMLMATLATLVMVVRTAPSTTTTTTTTTTTEATTTPKVPGSDGTECFLSKSSDNEKRLLNVINVMKGMKFEWEDKDHKYYFSVCTTANNAQGKSDGFIQVNKENNSTYVLGRLDDVDMEGVENIVRVAYNNGDQYQRACNKSERNAVIYFVCDKNQQVDNFTMLEENNAKEKGCEYIFELKTSKICASSSSDTTTASTTTTSSSSSTTTTTTTTSSSSTTNKTPTSTNSATTGAPASTTTSADSAAHKATSRLGVVSILAISMASLFLIYMIIGTLYLRFVNQARGVEQIPHLAMWRSIGDKFSSCYHYVFRCGQRQAEVHSYENINDRISDDENLLNM